MKMQAIKKLIILNGVKNKIIPEKKSKEIFLGWLLDGIKIKIMKIFSKSK